MGPCRSTQAQVGSFRPIQVLQPGVSDLTSFIHPCRGPPVKAQGGWAAPVGAATCKTSFSAAYICFSYLSQVLTMQPSIPAGQGGQAGRWVCPAAGQGGLWHLVRQLVASQQPGLAPLWGWHSQRALALPSRRRFGLRMSSPGLAGSGGGFVPVPVDCSLAGPARRKAAGLVWPCQLPPRASHWTWTTNKALSLRTGQKRNRDPNAAQPKEGEINHKSERPTPSSIRGVSFMGYLLPGFAPVPI